MKRKNKKGFFYYLFHVFRESRNQSKIARKQHKERTKLRKSFSHRNKEKVFWLDTLLKPFKKNNNNKYVTNHKHSKNNNFFKSIFILPKNKKPIIKNKKKKSLIEYLKPAPLNQFINKSTSHKNKFSINKRKIFLKNFIILLANPKQLLQFIQNFPEFLKQKLLNKSKSNKKIDKKLSFWHILKHILFQANKDLFRGLTTKYKLTKESLFQWVENTKKIAKSQDDRMKFINTAITSTIAYIITFIFAHTFYQFVTVMVASHFEIRSTLFFYGITWPGPDSPLWNFDSVISIFISGPILSFILGLFYLALFFIFIIKDGYGFLKLFFVWSYLHAFNLFFGAFIVGVITSKNFGYAQDWMYLNSTDKYIISTISIFVLALIGFFSTKPFMQCSLSYYIIKKDNRILFIISQVFIPWLVGSFLILLIKFPKNNMPDALLFFPLIFAFLPVFPNYFSFWTARIKLPIKRREPHVEQIHVFILLIVLILYRVALNFGIRF